MGKQVDLRGAQIEVGSRHAVSLRDNAHVEGDIHFHNHDRTPQGIPLQRSQQADYLVGREKLLNQVLAGLQPGKALTLCGPGGIGKTALAARVAWELAPEQEAPALFPDGLIFYSFYGRKDVSLAYEHLLRSYLDEGQENGPEAVRQLLANKQALIVLDGAEDADNLPAVLRCCGGCGVLITSRKRSDAPGKLLKVKPLDYEQAVQYFEQCLPIMREVGDKIGEGTTLNNIGAIYDAQGKPAKAVEYHQQSLAIRWEQGDRAGEAQSCWNIGRTYEDLGDFVKAEEYIALAVEIKEAIGTPDAEECRNYLE